MSNPVFTLTAINPFGLNDVGILATPAFVDIDADGDFDAFVGEAFGNMLFYRNTGTTSHPTYATAITNPFGLSNAGFYIDFSFVDIDNDGDLDAFIGNSDLAGFNSNKFDVPFLVEEFLRAEVDFDLKNRKLVDVQNIFHFMEPRNLKAAYKFYCGKELINAHSAEADTVATYEIFVAQLERYENSELKDEKGNSYNPVKNDIASLSVLTAKTKNADLAGRIVFNENNVEVFSFGKHKDKPVTEVFEKEPSYYNWMMQGDFPLYTKRIITQIRLGMKK